MGNKYNWWIRILGLLLAWLLISSYFVPMPDKGGDYLPLFSGFIDLSYLNDNVLLSSVLGIAFLSLIAIALYLINSKSLNHTFIYGFTISFFLIIAFSNPSCLYFSSVHPAVLLLIWTQYCLIENQLFTSMFLVSCSLLFYAPVIYFVPLLLFFGSYRQADILRSFAKLLSGLLTPILYLLSFRFLFFDDAGVFVEQFFSYCKNVNLPFNSLSITTLFFCLCVTVVAIHSLYLIISRLSNNNIVTGKIFSIQIVSFAMAIVLFFFFGGNASVPLNLFLAVPMSFILSNYFTKRIGMHSARVMLFLIMCAAVIVSVSWLI